MAQPWPAAQGLNQQRRLYMPEVIVAGPNALNWRDAPLPHQEWHAFPFPQPLGNPPLSRSLKCKKLEAALIKTEHGVTQTAGQIMDMPREDRLRCVRRSDTLFHNLVAYGSPDGPGVPTVVPPGHAATNVPRIHTGRCVGVTVGLPSRQQQANVLDKLFPWFVMHERRSPAAMTSEPAVQDEVHVQIIELLNLVLESRYESNVGQAPQTLFYPQWGRSCPKAHRTPGVKTNAGFPDFLLYMGSQPK
ncbi:hypothetical protein JB92DRAFT_3126985 [Gautieria morchelliformis]|nr:hypothetical protein JB92DRAFT_3126985 [Gautieria morchelliformis]